jgi:RND family efflux transporter MFP subunit
VNKEVKMKVIIKLLLFLVTVSSALYLMSCGGEEVEKTEPVVRPVKTMVVGEGASGTRSLPGTVQAANRVEMSFRVGGPLIDFPVKEGEKVKKGQLLARIDPRDFRIAVDKAKAEFNKADADYKRYQQLYEKEAVPLADLELRQAQRDVTKSQLDDASANLDDTYLRAPFKGEIGETYFQSGEDVKAKEPVLGLHGTDVVEIVVNVPEAFKARFDPKISMDRKITAKFSFEPDREFDLLLTEFSAAADPRTQTYKTTLSMPQPDGVNIQPGMTAEVKVYALESDRDQTKSEYVVPAVAVFAGDDDSQFVWVVDQTDMIVHRTKVTVGAVTGTSQITILDGISAGDRIVIAGVTTLRDSMKVSYLEDHYNIDGGSK